MSELLDRRPPGADLPSPKPAASEPPAARLGFLVVLGWELEKLTAQLRTRLAFLACLLGPFAFVAAVKLTHNVPADTLFGRWIEDSGLATPLVVLGFASSWGFPALVCIVAGDIFSAEDHFGTWKTILTRSRARSSFFIGKILAAAIYSVVMIVLLAGASVAAGVLIIGHQDLNGLSGNVLPAGHALTLALLAWLSVLPSALAFASIAVLLSVATRNSLVAIGGTEGLGLLLQFATLVDGIAPVSRLLPGAGLLAWHGLFADPGFTGPIVISGVSSACYIAVCLLASRLLFARRDFAGGS